MPYKYKRRYYNNNYRRKSYKKYDPMEDIAMIGSIGVVGLGIYIIQIFRENPWLIWLGLGIVVLSLGVFTYYLYIKKRRRYIKVETVKQMQDMSWREFEYFIEFLFKQNGFKAKVGKGKSDGGIDVTATKNGERYLVQCKKWNKDSKIYRENKIGVKLLREFYGVMNMDSPTTKGVYVTTSELTEPAKKEYQKIKDRLELWDFHTIEKYIAEFKEKKDNLFENKTPICEKCGAETVLKEAHRGENKGHRFYGCSNFPKCRYTSEVREEV